MGACLSFAGFHQVRLSFVVCTNKAAFSSILVSSTGVELFLHNLLSFLEKPIVSLVGSSLILRRRDEFRCFDLGECIFDAFIS